MAISIAEVRAHGRVMRYRRLGAGPPLLLLGAEGAEGWASRYRVIVPDLPGSGEDVAGWLSAFLEGLGASGVTVVAAEPFYTAARDVAVTDPDRLAQVILPS